MKPFCHPSAADAVLEALVAITDQLDDAIAVEAQEQGLEAIRAARRPAPDANALLFDPCTHDWLRNALVRQLDRDPLDAVRDTELLLGALKLRLVASTPSIVLNSSGEIQKIIISTGISRTERDAASLATNQAFDEHGRFMGLKDDPAVIAHDSAAMEAFDAHLATGSPLPALVGRCSKCGRGTQFRSLLGRVCGFLEPNGDKCPGILSLFAIGEMQTIPGLGEVSATGVVLANPVAGYPHQ